MYLGTVLLFIMVLAGLDEKIVLLFDKDRKLIWKFLLYAQVMTAVIILQISIAYVFN